VRGISTIGSIAQVPVLYIADKMLSPTLDGASLRGFNMIRAMCAMGVPVAFISHHPNSFPPYRDTLAEDTAELEELGVEVAAPPASASVPQHLAGHGDRYGVVIMTPYSIAYRYLPMVREYAPRSVAIHMAMDLGHVQHFRRARRSGNVPDLRRAIEAKKWETWLTENADCTLAVSEQEREILLELCPSADVRIASHIVEPHPDSTDFGDRRNVMFLGSFPHVANVEAILYFANEILPTIRKSIPDITIEIVGTDPPAEVTDLEGPGISVTGRVPDLAPFFGAARVFVAPLLHGAGIKIKVLESLGHGVPTVVTPLAAEGLHLTDGIDTLIAGSADDFAAAVIRLYSDEDLWRRLVAGGFELIASRFSRAAMEKTLTGLLALAAGRG